jgi:hypothetical protein
MIKGKNCGNQGRLVKPLIIIKKLKKLGKQQLLIKKLITLKS